jgi:hypothetical protein
MRIRKGTSKTNTRLPIPRTTVVERFYNSGLPAGAEFMPIMPPPGYATDRQNPITPLPKNPYPDSAFLR